MKFHSGRRGFTVIEVILFLGISMALFVGMAAATQNSIYQQRYTDSVENFAEFLRRVYSQTPNIQSESTGRSDKAIYGKLVTFNIENGSNGKRNDIKTYNLIGDVEEDSSKNLGCPATGDVLTRLCRRDASVVIDDGGTKHTVGFVEDYIVRWSAGLQTKAPFTASSDGRRDFVGILIITRSPDSGNVFTYFMRPNKDDRETNPDASAAAFNNGEYNERRNRIKDIIKAIEDNRTDALMCNGGHCFSNPDNFDTDDIDFCVNPGGLEAQIDLRRNIRISGGNHNASGVQVVTDEPYRDDFKEGNRCKS